MKRNLVLGFLAMLAISGCQVKEEGELAPECKTFTATMEAMDDDANNVFTKTSMDASGNVRWKRGDQVSIFAGRNINDQYQIADAYDGRTEAALNPVSSPRFVSGTSIDNNVAFYPYSSTAILDKSGSAYVISGIVLPESQTYAESSFGNGAFPMVAVTSSTNDYNLKFKNVLGGLKLQLKGNATITSISITGNNNDVLCGAVEVTVSAADAPAITLSDATRTIVTLDCGDGVQLNAETATAFIFALPPMTMSGGFTVTVTDTENKQMEIKTTKSQTITRSNLLSMPAVMYEGTGSDPVSEPVAVDLGLPSGLKWASFNVGATAPEEYGDYFAWGETEPHYSSLNPLTWKENKTGYYWTNYEFRSSGDNRDNVKFSKYNTSISNGPIDNKTVLDSEDDAAAANWGGMWRMPTDEEWYELIDECTWTWTTQNGVYGRLVTSNTNGNSIFLPAAGHRAGNDLLDTGSNGTYWSSSFYRPWDAWRAFFNSDNVFRYYCWERYYGFPVRPVTDEGVRVSVTGVSLIKDSLDLFEGKIASLTTTVTPSNATQPAVIWSSSNTSVATVDYTGKVTAVAAGNATITATTHDGGFTATCTVTVSAVPEAVDLGLPSGLKWATCNVGASTPEEYGDYFAWGETEPFSGTYKWSNGSSYTKYCTNSSDGVVDNKTVLDPEDDAAAVNWGGSWRMPTNEEWCELIDKCTWTWTNQSGVNGRLVTGPNGNSIFLPAAGRRGWYDLDGAGSGGLYWSSLLCQSAPWDTWAILFTSEYVYTNGLNRELGFTVRPVSDDGIRVSVSGVSLNKNSFNLVEGETASLTATVTPSNATQPNVIWSSSDNSVATVDYTGMVTAVSAGVATITATAYDGGFTATCSVTVGPTTGTINGYDWVDLGLTSGLKWASCNVGASAPEEYGDYFAWGGTAPQESYNWSTCPFRTSGDSWDTVKFSKYNTSSSYGPIDNNTVLDPEDDAATANWGGNWRMPTDAEWKELRTECTWTWTTQNGVNGRLVTGPNGNSIFLPAAGDRYGTSLYDAGSYGNYWSSSLYTGDPLGAYCVDFDYGYFDRYLSYRCYGLSVRPVTE